MLKKTKSKQALQKKCYFLCGKKESVCVRESVNITSIASTDYKISVGKPPHPLLFS